MTEIEYVAWTGGSSPLPPAEVPQDEWEYVWKLFREDLAVWESAWGNRPDKDTRNIMWNRARHDAHATFRHAAKVETLGLMYGKTPDKLPLIVENADGVVIARLSEKLLSVAIDIINRARRGGTLKRNGNFLYSRGVRGS